MAPAPAAAANPTVGDPSAGEKVGVLRGEKEGGVVELEEEEK